MKIEKVYIILAEHLDGWHEIISIHLNEDEAADRCQYLYNHKPFGIVEYFYGEHKINNEDFYPTNPYD